ncbi:CHAP domain-containing protein [Microbulbifer sp. 2304DJ12-6]|uniref:CHAP domain-containing protein n=1 Tax=Microbulbifer sp. 2304DJ12-6 TaxID=3233340 RepID=UPI0039B0D0B5
MSPCIEVVRIKKYILACILSISLVVVGYKLITSVNLNRDQEIGEIVDSLDGVTVHFNGGVNHVLERNLASDGYNLGLKYQCVEFVKRFYYEHFGHRMPDTYGHARDFFDPTVSHGELNPARGLLQYRNGGTDAPKYGDILIFKPSITNPYGHVAIVSGIDLDSMKIEITQQNPGPFSPSREVYDLSDKDGWSIQNGRIVGWLRLEQENI